MEAKKIVCILVIMLLLILIVLPIGYDVYKCIRTNIQHTRNEVKKKDREKRVQELLPEVEVLLQEIEAVLSGKKIIEDEENWLKTLNRVVGSSPRVTEIRARVEVWDIRLEGNGGYIDITYWIKYLNSEGESLGGGITNVRLTIEEKEDEWMVTGGKAIKVLSE